VWSTDGRRVLFASNRAGGGQYNVYAKNTDGTGPVEQITKTVDAHPTSVAGDGIICNQFDKGQSRIVRLTSGAHAEPLIDPPVEALAGQVSSDGRYIAYQSNESGRYEVYVSPYPNVTGGRWQVSTDGGTYPMWARTGTELFFLDGAFVMTAVPVTTGPGAFSSGKEDKLFDARSYGSGSGREYDVSLDGSRFLMVKENRAVESSVAAPAILVVVNWFENLRSTLQAKR
jgi:serine/threonine-protein kinase